MEQRIQVIGVPLDLGANRRGVDMGPSAIRYAGLKKRLQNNAINVRDIGDIFVPAPESRIIENEKLKYLDVIKDVNTVLADQVSEALKNNYRPVILGGDHAIAIGSIAGVSQRVKRMGLIWFDAHGDFNTAETTPSGNIHGMPLAVSLGYGAPELTNIGGFVGKVKPEDVVVIGLRDVDLQEKKMIKQSGVNAFTMHEVDRMGIKEVMEQALKLVTKNTDGFHVSFDLDVMDPMEAPGVGTRVRGGLNYREAHLAMELIAETKKMISLDMVEVNPILDQGNRTAELAVELIASALGENIL
ncbi:arginase [Alkalicella caledoniensis]|uniref:Arginase n=1 Tax=Alkalicella caledoniensis TaxID=2731377 RepID=A0A7G9W7S8_ALKCA|nr:arginase [Alkalicella caledoniensis]QNO14740.1 arginase [Alkalicella caledoniensis]